MAKQPVTLSVEEAQQVANMLLALAATRWTGARRTKSSAIKAYCEREARAASDLESELIRRMYGQEQLS